MKEKKEVAFNIFSADNPAFKQLMTTCDNLYRELRKEGVRASSAPTETLIDAQSDPNVCNKFGSGSEGYWNNAKFLRMEMGIKIADIKTR